MFNGMEKIKMSFKFIKRFQEEAFKNSSTTFYKIEGLIDILTEQNVSQENCFRYFKASAKCQRCCRAGKEKGTKCQNGIFL